MLAGMTLFDWFVVVIIVLSTIMAAAQGLVLELVSSGRAGPGVVAGLLELPCAGNSAFARNSL